MMHPHLAARVFNTPLLIHPQKLDAIIAGVGQRLLGASVTVEHANINSDVLSPEMFTSKRPSRADMERGYQVVNGVAVLSTMGALVHRSRMTADSTMLLGYDDITAQLEIAHADPDVHAIAHIFDSPGGEGAGAFEFAQRIYDLRGSKPIVAIADTLAASAAFLAASAADEVVITPTGYVGSVGVVMRHVDFSQALQKNGVTVTPIFAGAHKIDGNPYEPLPESVRADMQAEIDSLYSMFVGAVAKHTGMSTEAVRATQARTYRGQSAVDIGFATRLSTADALIAELADKRARTYPVSTTTKATTMSTTAPATAATAADTPDHAALDAAHAAGVTAERARVSAILGHECASANMSTALQCISAGLTADQSSAILATLPKVAGTSATAEGAGFAAAMDGVQNPDVSGVEASTDATGAQANAEALAKQMLASFQALTK